MKHVRRIGHGYRLPLFDLTARDACLIMGGVMQVLVGFGVVTLMKPVSLVEALVSLFCAFVLGLFLMFACMALGNWLDRRRHQKRFEKLIEVARPRFQSWFTDFR